MPDDQIDGDQASRIAAFLHGLDNLSAQTGVSVATYKPADVVVDHETLHWLEIESQTDGAEVTRYRLRHVT